MSVSIVSVSRPHDGHLGEVSVLEKCGGKVRNEVLINYRVEAALHLGTRGVELLEGDISQAGELVFLLVAADCLDDGIVALLWEGVVLHVSSVSTGLGDDAAEQLLISASVGSSLVSNVATTSTLTEDGNLGGITAKGSDVLVDPVQGDALILQAKVGYSGIENVLTGHEAPE
ncbi:hypothetical protein HG530_013771 [Fusarium avenaceum]|nr:hypothetical protein HG530_013771 [Fusarium avenaceum]